MTQTTRPLFCNANKSRRLIFKYRLLESDTWPLETARQDYQIAKPKRSPKGG